MRLASLQLKGFRCFGEPVTLAFSDLTALVGANGTGKSSVLMALVRMFGPTVGLRTLTKADFYQSEEIADDASLEIEARFEFPELGDDVDAAASLAVPECLRNILADDGGDVPIARIRLRATWTDTASPEGDVEQHLEWIASLDDEFADDAVHPLQATERSLIQVVYVPATRDAIRELRTVSGTILSRALRSVEWSDEGKEALANLSEDMAKVVRDEDALVLLEASLVEQWKTLRGGNGGEPELSIAETDLPALLRRLDPRIKGAASGERPLELMSEGERSLLYFALVASALELEAELVTDGKAVAGAQIPALTLVAVEEPENHLAPQYLSRILAVLRGMNAKRNAQIIVTSHSPAILRRIEPEEVRHFRVEDAGNHVISEIPLPEDDVTAIKYVREAVTSHPELYFARVVVLGEGPSEEVVIPRVARAFGLDVDPRFVSVVPLGGRHVHHFWRLLSAIGTPYVTLVDLDNGREGGGWARIETLLDQLVARGEDVTKVWSPSGRLAGMSTWQATASDQGHMPGWLARLETSDVFVSSPLDLDLMFLAAFSAEYQALIPTGHGPRIPAADPDLTKYLERADSRTLGEGGNAAVHSTNHRQLFPWYGYLFIAGSKPTTHARMLATIDDDALAARTPAVLQRLVNRVKDLAKDV